MQHITNSRKKLILGSIIGLAFVAFLAAVFYVIVYNPARADESFSYIECQNTSLPELFEAIKGGADNSYLHALLLWTSFKIFGPSLLIQRLLSFFLWAIGIVFFFGSALNATKSRLYSLFLTGLIGLSNIGYFLAADGRFYSLIFLLSTLILFKITRSIKRRRSPNGLLLFFIVLAGLLTSIISVLFPLMVLGAILVLFFFSSYNSTVRRCFIILLVESVLATIVYLALFKIDFFLDVQMHMLSSPVEKTLKETALYTFSNIPRWFALPMIPFTENAIGVIAFLVIVAVLYFLGFRHNASLMSKNYAVRFTSIAGLMALLFIPLKFFLNLIQPFWIDWPVRYYTPIFFLPAFLFLPLMLKLQRNARFILLLIFSVGFLLGSVSYLVKYSDKKNEAIALKKLKERISGKKIYFVEDEEVETGRLFAALYCKYPDLQSQMAYLSNSSIQSRIANLGKLSAINPVFKFRAIEDIGQLRFGNDAVIFTNAADDVRIPGKNATEAWQDVLIWE